MHDLSARPAGKRCSPAPAPNERIPTRSPLRRRMLCTAKLSYSSVSIRNAPAAQDYLTHPSQEFLRFQSYISPKSGLGVTSPGMGRFILECVVAYLSRSLVLSIPDSSLAIWLGTPF